MDNDHEITISDIPDGTVFYIPDYQRGYRWTEKEVSALLDDLLAFALSGETGETYCLQPLVLQRKNGRLWVVDGQQRLTTMSIILCSLGLASGWDIEYTAEGGRRLGELLKFPGASINDYFRNMARKTVSDWLKVDASRREDIGRVLSGESDKRVVFLRHDLREDENGHEAFQRLNAGKTPLTSSELIRALYMEAGNGLDNGEKADIAKEWSLIESAMAEESFWSIWANKRFRDVPTRMDFLLSIVADIDSEEARQDPLLVYRAFEKAAMNAECRLVSAEGLRRLWEETLRCWWWMQSCNADVEAFHLLGWLSLFTGRKTRVLFRELWKDTAGCRMEAFKRGLRKIVAESIGEEDFDSFRYGECESETLRKVFVLLNMLESERRSSRFRFDLYRERAWDVEHIASRTDNPLSGKANQDEWLRLAMAEMSAKERSELAKCKTFAQKWSLMWATFESDDDTVSDKDGIGNLALLDSGTNRSYGNAIFPVKRRRVIFEAMGKGSYVPSLTEAAFAKSYSPGATQMRYWGESDAAAYHDAMKAMFEEFMDKAKENVK